MKFTPSTLFLHIARSSGKLMERRVYFRKTESLSLSLDSGTWIEATGKIDGVPEAIAQIEYALGQFSADSIQLTGKDIVWWDAHIFNAGIEEYIECKIEFRIGDDPNHFASDTVYYFSGFVDKRTIIPAELDDSYAFTVDTVDVVADLMLGEFLSTKYFDELKGGIALFKVPGIYVSSTNTGTNPLAAGIHTLSYQYNDGSQQARLDDGDWVSITADGDYTIGNGATGIDETQQIRVKVYTSELVRDNNERSDKIIMRTSPSDLPFVWYAGISLRAMLRTIYTTLGVNSDAFNLSKIDTWDGSLRMSMLEFIADGQANIGTSLAIEAASPTTLYVGNANNVFRLNPQTGVFSLACTVESGHRISRLIYNSRTNHLWILHGEGGETRYGESISRYNSESGALSSPVSVPHAEYGNIELFDFMASALGQYEYCLLFPNRETGAIMRIDGGTLTVTTLFTRSDLGYAASYGPTARHSYSGTRGHIHFYRFQTISIPGNLVHELTFNDEDDGAWQNAGIATPIPFTHEFGAYDHINGIVFGLDADAGAIKSYLSADGSPFETVYTLTVGDSIDCLYHDGSGLFFSTALDRQVHRYDGEDILTFGIAAYTAYSAFVTVGGITYGVDNVGRVFMVSDSIELFLDTCDYTDKSIKNAITDALRACNCVSTISASKKALVYNRGDSEGNPVTSGNSIDITVDNAEDITKDPEYGQAFDIIEIDNGSVKMNYNGVAYNVMPSSLTERVLRIQNMQIHTSVVKDYLKMFFEYFKTARVLYKIPVAQTMFHIEPMDAANVTFTATKIKVTATGRPIYSASYTADDGTMQLGVLI